jgi:hypothetical protein
MIEKRAILEASSVENSVLMQIQKGVLVSVRKRKILLDNDNKLYLVAFWNQ